MSEPVEQLVVGTGLALSWVPPRPRAAWS